LWRNASNALHGIKAESDVDVALPPVSRLLKKTNNCCTIAARNCNLPRIVLVSRVDTDIDHTSSSMRAGQRLCPGLPAADLRFRTSTAAVGSMRAPQ